MNTSLKMTRCFPFYRQRVTVPRSLVPCTSFRAVTEYGFGKEEVVDRQQGVKGDFFLGAVMVELGQEEGSNLLVLDRGDDRGWSDHSGYPPPL